MSAQAAVEAVRALHRSRTEQVVTGACAREECEHEDSRDCQLSPFDVCAACWAVAEEANAYFMEEFIASVHYPCATIKALGEAA